MRLARSAHTVRAVFTKPDRPAGRGRAVHQSPVKQRALELGIPVHQPASFKTRRGAARHCCALQSGRAGRGRLRLDPAAGGARGATGSAASISMPPCCRAGAARRRSSARCWPAMRRHRHHHHAHGGRARHRADAVRCAPIDIEAARHGGKLCTIGWPKLGGELICETLDALARGPVLEDAAAAAGVTYAQKISKVEALIDWRRRGAGVLRQSPGVQSVAGRARRAGTESSCASGRPSSLPPRPRASASRPPGTVLGAAPCGIDVACGYGALRITRLQLAGRKPVTAAELPEFAAPCRRRGSRAHERR